MGYGGLPVNRNRPAIALLAVVGVAFAAPVFETPQPGSGGPGEGDAGPEVDPIEGPQPVMEGSKPSSSSAPSTC